MEMRRGGGVTRPHSMDDKQTITLFITQHATRRKSLETVMQITVGNKYPAREMRREACKTELSWFYVYMVYCCRLSFGA